MIDYASAIPQFFVLLAVLAAVTFTLIYVVGKSEDRR